MIRRAVKSLCFAVLLSVAAVAQDPADLMARVRQYRQQHETEIIRQYADLLAVDLAVRRAGSIPFELAIPRSVPACT